MTMEAVNGHVHNRGTLRGRNRKHHTNTPAGGAHLQQYRNENKKVRGVEEMDVYTTLKLLYILFGVSLLLNVVLLYRMKLLESRLREMESRVTLSEEEIEQITSRLRRISELHGEIELPPPIKPRR